MVNEANVSKSYVPNQYNTGYSIRHYEPVKKIVTHINYLLKQLEDAKQNFEDILEHIENK